MRLLLLLCGACLRGCMMSSETPTETHRERESNATKGVCRGWVRIISGKMNVPRACRIFTPPYLVFFSGCWLAWTSCTHIYPALAVVVSGVQQHSTHSLTRRRRHSFIKERDRERRVHVCSDVEGSHLQVTLYLLGLAGPGVTTTNY